MFINLSHSEVLKEKKGWLFDKKLSGGGVVINPTAHILAWLIFNFGVPKIRKVKLNQIHSKAVEDEANISLTFKDLKVNLISSWSRERYPFIDLNINLKGSFGEVVLDNKKIDINLTKRVGKYRQSLKSPLSVIPSRVAYKKGLTSILQAALRTKESLNLNPEGFADAYYYQDQEFLKNLEQGKPFVVDFEKALEIERVIDQIYAKA